MRLLFIALISLAVISSSNGQSDTDFASFLSSFKETMEFPMTIEVESDDAYKKKAQISMETAKAVLDMKILNVGTGAKVPYYSSLIDPQPLTKYEGSDREFMDVSKAYPISKMEKDTYILCLVRLHTETKGFDNMNSFQYLLHSFKPDGTPICVLPVAQHVQFDFHYNEISGSIDKSGAITLNGAVVNGAGEDNFVEKYQLETSGMIKKVGE